MTFEYLTAVYFRHVNQSDPAVQDQMRSYLDDLLALDHVGGANPPFCWVRDFPTFQRFYEKNLGNMTFNEQLAYALSIPALDEVYGSDIVLDNITGEIIASRCWIFVSNIDYNDVNNQLDFYESLEEATLAQPNNSGLKEQAFFTFEYLYFLWEFYGAIVRELTFTTIVGVVAVVGIGFLLIPHWSASLFVFPLIVMLYIDVMGKFL